MDQADIVQRDLARLELDGYRLALFLIREVNFAVEAEVRVLDQVMRAIVAVMGAGDHPHRAVLVVHLVDCDPDRAGDQWIDWPERAVLMPRDGATAAGRLAEKMGQHEDQVRSKNRLGHVEDARTMRDIVKRLLTAHAVGCGAVEMRVGEAVGQDVGVVRLNLIHRAAKRRDLGFAQAKEMGNDPSVPVVGSDLVMRQHEFVPVRRHPSFDCAKASGVGSTASIIGPQRSAEAGAEPRRPDQSGTSGRSPMLDNHARRQGLGVWFFSSPAVRRVERPRRVELRQQPARTANPSPTVPSLPRTDAFVTNFLGFPKVSGSGAAALAEWRERADESRD